MKRSRFHRYFWDICDPPRGAHPRSRDAWEKVRETLNDRQRAVYEAIVKAGKYGATMKEVAALLGVPLNTISGRFSELQEPNVEHPQRKGLIVDSGTIRDRCTVWCAAPLPPRAAGEPI